MCGCSLVLQGYCEVCEGWVPASPGAECPKHDVTLLEGPTEPNLDLASTPMVTIATYGRPHESQGPQLRLEAEGIPVFVEGERMGANGIYLVAMGGVKLQVPEEYAAEARVILSQSWASIKDEGENSDDPWEGLEPPHPADRRRSLMKKVIILFLFWPAAVFAIGLLFRVVNSLMP